MSQLIGKIYKIVAPDQDMCYIGSTTLNNFKYRLSIHKTLYNHYIIGNANYCSSYELIGRYDGCIIILIEIYACNNREELRKRENFWIEFFPCVNKINAYSDRNLYMREYYHDHKKKILKQRKNQVNNMKKNKFRIPVRCDACNQEISYKHISRHNKSIYHIKNMK